MTDHRATDLSYGHLGEASYDVDEQSWCFPREASLGKLDRVDHTINAYLFHRILHTALAASARMYISISASSSKLD
jgi:hypothetical protein